MQNGKSGRKAGETAYPLVDAIMRWLARPFCTVNIGGHGCAGFYVYGVNSPCLDHTIVRPGTMEAALS